MASICRKRDKEKYYIMGKKGKVTKTIPLAVIFASVVTVVFRTFQIIFAVDYNEMGFFNRDMGFFACGGLYIFFALFAAAFIALAILDRQNDSIAFTRRGSSISSKGTGILGFSFIIAAALKLIELVFGFSELKSSTVNLLMEIALFIVFAAVGFLILSKKTLGAGAGYMLLLAAICYTVKSAALFMRDTIIVRVSDELILLLSYILSVVFFLALGRFFSDNESRFSRIKLMVFSGGFIMLSLSASLSGYIAWLIDKKYMEAHMAMHPISQLGAAVIGIAALYVLYYDKNKNKASSIQEEKV